MTLVAEGESGVPRRGVEMDFMARLSVHVFLPAIGFTKNCSIIGRLFPGVDSRETISAMNDSVRQKKTAGHAGGSNKQRDSALP
jgi:hypothetical protein